MNKQSHLLEVLGHSRMFQDFARAYTEATGLPVALRPVETWQAPLHGRPNENGFCALMSETSHTCAPCLRAQERLARLAMEHPATTTCPYGLCETAVPLKVGPHTIGFLQTGQATRQKPTAERVGRVLGRIARLGVTLDPERAKETYRRTPFVSQKRMESVTTLLRLFAEHLSMKSNQLALREQNAEPPLVTRARRFVEEHHREKLTLSRVTRALHASVFYFCKQFKKATGLTFTDFVARTRVEQAKRLLGNPHRRVSAIAFEAGFQSVTHFNRIFKRIVGQSPTAYRERMPAAR